MRPGNVVVFFSSSQLNRFDTLLFCTAQYMTKNYYETPNNEALTLWVECYEYILIKIE